MTETESRPLLEFLYAHAIGPEFTCRLRWRTNDLAIWDNRCAMHYAVNDYDGDRKLMHRPTIKGERPSRRTGRTLRAGPAFDCSWPGVIYGIIR
jgi:alpha-ketoglutarate-dependent taurine dioxygenase